MERILVTFTTWAGATRGVAEVIGETLQKQNAGAEVDVIRAKEVEGVEAYDAYVIGSSVHAGKLPREIRKFVRRHRKTLREHPVTYFVVCLTMKEDTLENRETASGYLNPLRELVPEAAGVESGLFAGAVLAEGEDFENLFPLLRIPIRAMAEDEGDSRDWEAIREWATKLHDALEEA